MSLILIMNIGNRKSWFVLLFASLIILCSCNGQTKTIPEDTIVKINDYCVLKSEIDAVYNEYEATGISYKRIIEDTILEQLVVQKADTYGITLSGEELENIMLEFKEHNPDLYNESIEIYGYNSLKEKLRIRNLFSKTKDYIMSNVLFVNGVTSEMINSFKVEYGLEEQLSHFSDEQIINDLGYEIEEFIFKEWMKSLKDEADITYFNSTKESVVQN